MADGTITLICAALPRRYWELIRSVIADRAWAAGDSDRIEFDVLEAVSEVLRSPPVTPPEEHDGIPEPFV